VNLTADALVSGVITSCALALTSRGKSGTTAACARQECTGGRSAAGAWMPERMQAASVFRAHARTTSSGLQLRDGMRFEEWVALGTHIERISSASAWWTGDWLLYGEHAYGTRYQSALAHTRLGYQTLRNYAWVAQRFEMSRRRDSLSFGHHAELAALAEADQEIWLQRAERRCWSRNQLRRQLAATRRRRCVQDASASVVLRLQIPSDREHVWRQAAAVADQDLIDWIAAAVDRAADTLVHAPSITSGDHAADVPGDVRPVPALLSGA
jgi:hypothetical protein